MYHVVVVTISHAACLTYYTEAIDPGYQSYLLNLSSAHVLIW